MPVLQVPPLVVALPLFTIQPRSSYSAGVRSRRRLPSRSWLIDGSISALGLWLMSKCENVEPAASVAGAYSSARPSASVPAKLPSTSARATVAPGIPAFRMAPSACDTLIVGTVAATVGSSAIWITPVVLLATITAMAPASCANFALISKAQVPRSTTATLPA